MTKPEKCYAVVYPDWSVGKIFLNEEHAWDYVRAMSKNDSNTLASMCCTVLERDLQ